MFSFSIAQINAVTALKIPSKFITSVPTFGHN